MTLPASGTISISQVNTEVGAAATTNRALSWVQSNTVYAYKDLNSIHNYSWFTSYSSKNSYSRTPTSYTSNCAANCAGQYNGYNYDGGGGWTNCYLYTNCAITTYSHGTYLQANCNCNCNCAYNCHYNNCNCQCQCSDSSCFPAGTTVTLSDGSLKKIEDIVVGDVVKGLSGNNPVVAVETPILGNRQLMGMADGSLLWSEEHPLWVKRGDKQWWMTCNFDVWMKEVETEHIKGLKNNDSMFRWNGTEEQFAVDKGGWKTNQIVPVFGAMNRPDLQLYFIVVGGDKTLFVNGYCVSGGTDEWSSDYTKLKWE